MRLALIVSCLLLAGAAGAEAPLAPTDATDPAAGAIYGTVTDRDGRDLVGFLRFDGWDTWWDDLFAADRDSSPWEGLVDEAMLKDLARERRDAYFATHGLVDRLAYALDGGRRVDLSRRLVCRYGQVARVTLGRDDGVVETVDGNRYPVRPGRGDLDGDLTVATAGGDSTVLDFDDVRGIVFAQAPAGALPPWQRLAGEVTTTGGVLAGFVQWDVSENCDLDILDGEDDAGSHDIPMGDIAAIARSRGGSTVTLRDGNVLALSGTNDVNDDNRGLAVHVPGTGRVTVPWKDFVKVTFAAPGPSGAARAAFGAARPLEGRVAIKGGGERRGRLVLDLDEGSTWEILDGEHAGRDYTIPLGLVATLEPGDQGCTVTLRDGGTLLLTEGNDIDADNAGVLVIGPDGAERIAWSRVAALRFDP